MSARHHHHRRSSHHHTNQSASQAGPGRPAWQLISLASRTPKVGGAARRGLARLGSSTSTYSPLFLLFSLSPLHTRSPERRARRCRLPTRISQCEAPFTRPRIVTVLCPHYYTHHMQRILLKILCSSQKYSFFLGPYVISQEPCNELISLNFNSFG